jgi:hypothetical protein
MTRPCRTSTRLTAWPSPPRDEDEDEFASLTELINDIPKTEDLLDSASDAPIIRLING